MAAPALLSAPPPLPPMDEDGGAPHAALSPGAEGDPLVPRLRRRLPAVRVTSEFNSESRLFSHRLSCRVLEGLAKIRLRVHHGAAGSPLPEFALLARNFSVAVDTASRSAVLRGVANLAGSLRLHARHNTKEQQGEVAVTANLGDSPCKIELSSLVPPDGLPRTTFIFPSGEVSIKEKYLDEGERILSVNGIVKSHVLNGVCTTLYNDNGMNIKYRYKDEELSFIPSISLPSNSLSFAFKRQFTPSDKLSYRYQFNTNHWSAVYKHKANNKHVNWKAGYESDERLGWASLWVSIHLCFNVNDRDAD
ncbi:hypothetical protein GUJ93_ZPchr0009g1711 [Zizania palustris]|uniref:Outer envelope pore protein 37, chloroplastic n=1 Tax=Zizania palustris TaxID=103762 RepID=A0A8J5RXJ1_ZIZPA|nr:hypothetical protein GUJ93_ZPchr0009g1711 [Zizania palustris]